MTDIDAAAEIEWLKAGWKTAVNIGVSEQEQNKKLRDEIERLQGLLSLTETASRHERDGLQAEIERLLTTLRTCENTAKLNLKVAKDRGTEIERLTNLGQLASWDRIAKLEAEIERLNGILALSETAAAHERDGLKANAEQAWIAAGMAADQNARLQAAIQRIDGINDNPAGYNPEINEVCNSILRPGAPSGPEDDGPRVLTRDNPTGRRAASSNAPDESLEKIVKVLSAIFQDKDRAQQIFDRQVAGDISRETAIELLLDASQK